MMRSLFAGVTGLRSHQTRMDVIGNNIANVNTVGFKKSAVTFKDLYSETISAAAGASGDGSSGGVNPRQIGLGAAVNSISVVHTPGAAQYTGNSMDVAISGDGFFVVETPTGLKYTRAGNFYTDTAGNLVTAAGYYVKVVDPNVTSDVMLRYNKTNVDDLFPAGGGVFALPSSNVHSGTPTADLNYAMGKEFGFKFIKDGSGYFSNITKNYIPTYTLPSGVTLDDPTLVAGAGADGQKVTLNMKGIADAYLALVPAGTAPGGKAVTFEEDPVNAGVINILVDGIVVGSSQPITASTGATDPVSGDPVTSEVRISFGAAIGEVVISCPALEADGTAKADTSISDADQIAILTNLTGIPEIPLEEGGSWWLMNGTEQIEEVVLTSKTSANGAGIASGDILFTTASYGTFRLNLTKPLDGMQALSDELSSSKFSLDIVEEAYAIYESPSGEMSASALKTLTVDFSRFSNLSIDSKGAVIAQLKHDEIMTINGRSVQMKMGDKVVLGYIALANFNNPTGLEKLGDNLYDVTANSGDPTFMMPGSGSVGSLAPSNLEMSNVDLSEEMVNMIITQRGFQANSRIITVSDTMLEELINLKR